MQSLRCRGPCSSAARTKKAWTAPRKLPACNSRIGPDTTVSPMSVFNREQVLLEKLSIRSGVHFGGPGQALFQSPTYCPVRGINGGTSNSILPPLEERAHAVALLSRLAFLKQGKRNKRVKCV